MNIGKYLGHSGSGAVANLDIQMISGSKVAKVQFMYVPALCISFILYLSVSLGNKEALDLLWKRRSDSGTSWAGTLVTNQTPLELYPRCSYIWDTALSYAVGSAPGAFQTFVLGSTTS